MKTLNCRDALEHYISTPIARRCRRPPQPVTTMMSCYARAIVVLFVFTRSSIYNLSWLLVGSLKDLVVFSTQRRCSRCVGSYLIRALQSSSRMQFWKRVDDIHGGNPWMAMDSTHGQHQWMPSRATSMDAIHERHQWMPSMDDINGWHPWMTMDGIHGRHRWMAF